MSESVTAPLPQRDIRSASKEFKRDRDAVAKWSLGARPLYGVPSVRYDAFGSPTSVDEDELSPPAGLDKVRPVFPAAGQSHHKSSANQNPKPTKKYISCVSSGQAANRMARKTGAIVEAREDVTSSTYRSLFELIPQHANNAAGTVQTTVRDPESGVLYSFDNAGSSPGVRGRTVGLDSLVDMAEKKWTMEQTDKIVKGEYEVLDAEGETTVLSAKKGKKASPKQKALKNPTAVKQVDAQDDDGFELI